MWISSLLDFTVRLIDNDKHERVKYSIIDIQWFSIIQAKHINMQLCIKIYLNKFLDISIKLHNVS